MPKTTKREIPPRTRSITVTLKINEITYHEAHSMHAELKRLLPHIEAHVVFPPNSMGYQLRIECANGKEQIQVMKALETI